VDQPSLPTDHQRSALGLTFPRWAEHDPRGGDPCSGPASAGAGGDRRVAGGHAHAVPVRRPGGGRRRPLSLGTRLVGLLTACWVRTVVSRHSTSRTETGASDLCWCCSPSANKLRPASSPCPIGRTTMFRTPLLHRVVFRLILTSRRDQKTRIDKGTFYVGLGDQFDDDRRRARGGGPSYVTRADRRNNIRCLASRPQQRLASVDMFGTTALAQG
jgi:hypothetical protein